MCRLAGAVDELTRVETLEKELKLEGGDLSGHGTSALPARNDNGGEPKILLAVPCQRRSSVAVWQRVWRRKRTEDANFLILAVVKLLQRAWRRHL